MKKIFVMLAAVITMHGMGTCSALAFSEPTHAQLFAASEVDESIVLAQVDQAAPEVGAEEPAVKPPETIEESLSLLPQLISAIAAGKWNLVASFVVFFLTIVFRQYALPTLNLSTKVLPWVAIIIAFLNGWAANVIGGVELKEAAIMILVSGGISAQMWALGGKSITEFLLSLLGKEVAGKKA